jgi:hypothetical protein
VLEDQVTFQMFLEQACLPVRRRNGEKVGDLRAEVAPIGVEKREVFGAVGLEGNRHQAQEPGERLMVR